MEWLLFNNMAYDSLAMESEKQKARNNLGNFWSISKVESGLFPQQRLFKKKKDKDKDN